MKISKTVNARPTAKVSAPAAFKAPVAWKKRKCVAPKASTSSRCPATMLANNRMVSVAGRRMKVERNSIGVKMMYSTGGTPAGNSADLKYPPVPWERMPATMKATKAIAANSSGMPTTEDPAMLRPGMTPVMFMASTPKKMTVSTGVARRPPFFAQDLFGDVDPYEVQRHFDHSLGAARHELRAASGQPEQDDEHDRGDNADQHDPVELEDRAFEKNGRWKELGKSRWGPTLTCRAYGASSQDRRTSRQGKRPVR